MSCLHVPCPPISAVNDRIFSTAVSCTYTLPLPPITSTTPLSTLARSIDFDAIHASVTQTTLDIFATHNSASVQATLYNMCERILELHQQVGQVGYSLPNKVSHDAFALNLSTLC